jgi:hypothetical protein
LAGLGMRLVFQAALFQQHTLVSQENQEMLPK